MTRFLLGMGLCGTAAAFALFMIYPRADRAPAPAVETTTGWRLDFDSGEPKAPHSARAEFWRKRLADPATGEIPASARQLELEGYSALPLGHAKGESAWREVGPNNIGGRTRGMAIDHRDPN
ncbi:MAG: hypothetical protein AAGA95_09355, partial [Pseudomonadota bacterium]